ncbi:hypothetical protein AGABI1DRAFT_72253 [Agaricus bisporus var. burnettii JB137-S8]|uniref:Major facilitator superfamily (MFS) profile domain-containing protein n=1 Tax=Agaricus bisporus var. burnettii (strain JB137-S8 / ATCC MYA-4627 / FGSC 10392) TaxID=597362 RepID=K5Y0N9_AGABU|nr:uncharacterized protein AGABI1DRAFT_72253 [Agaricus bisporus var. burnettii JB137-S8]EKM81340.1 hypothetical protein AGABI1DRAFT_72253 [Agaricus bisporus var. burnettii JB137-S8]
MERNVASRNLKEDIEIKYVDALVESPPLEEIDPVAERKLVRKLDLILLPMFCLILYSLFSIIVSNTAQCIGNAKIAGLEADLGMKGLDFNIALTVFYICFTAIEVPSNLILKRVGSIWVAYLVLTFGAVALGSAFMKTYAHMLVTRVFLGIAEGGTLFYRRKELVLRMGFFFGIAASLSGACIITISIGLCLLVIIPEDPRKTRMLNESERAIAIARINADAAVKVDGRKEKSTWKLALRSFNIWTSVCAVGYLFVNISFQGLSLFLPTVINSPVVESQLRTVPCFLVGAVWSVCLCYASLWLDNRGTMVIASMVSQIAGYAIAIGTENPHARYAGCFLTVMGGTSSGPLLFTWGIDNAAPDTMRAIAAALIPGIGALGSIIAVWTYLPGDAPNFRTGNSINLAAGIAVIVFVSIGMLYLRHENRKRDHGGRDYRLEGKTEEEIRDLGYRHPGFRYQL